jgi:hypothetical protein
MTNYQMLFVFNAVDLLGCLNAWTCAVKTELVLVCKAVISLGCRGVVICFARLDASLIRVQERSDW